ncbi:MAG: AmmeMemoRadiSam system protein B, partial [Chloroflexota bacterium]
VLNGNAESFYNQIAAVQDQNRVCGFSPIYLMLRYLDTQTTGTKVAYDHCAADNEDNSLVSISGLLID